METMELYSNGNKVAEIFFDPSQRKPLENLMSKLGRNSAKSDLNFQFSVKPCKNPE